MVALTFCTELWALKHTHKQLRKRCAQVLLEYVEHQRGVVRNRNTDTQRHSVAIEQIKHGKRWNEDIAADPVEATKFLRGAGDINDTAFEQALCAKLVGIGNFEASELKQFLDATLAQKEHIDPKILAHYRREVQSWIDSSRIHLLQKKSIENLLKKL